MSRLGTMPLVLGLVAVLSGATDSVLDATRHISHEVILPQSITLSNAALVLLGPEHIEEVLRLDPILTDFEWITPPEHRKDPAALVEFRFTESQPIVGPFNATVRLNCSQQADFKNMRAVYQSASSGLTAVRTHKVWLPLSC